MASVPRDLFSLAVALGIGAVLLPRHASSKRLLRRFVGAADEPAAPQPRSPQGPVLEVTVRSGSFVDCVTFRYADGTSAAFGGAGGEAHAPFELAEGETLVEVRGRHGAYVESVQFVTSAGRVSPRYGGGEGGEGEGADFAFAGRELGGLLCTQSARGWLRQLKGVCSVGASVISNLASLQQSIF